MYFVYRNLVVDFDFDFVVQDMYFVYRYLVIDFDFFVQDMYMFVEFDIDVIKANGFNVMLQYVFSSSISILLI